MLCIGIIFDVGAEGFNFPFGPLLQMQSCALRALFFVFLNEKTSFLNFKNQKIPMHCIRILFDVGAEGFEPPTPSV